MTNSRKTVRLTKSVVDAAQPGPKEHFVWDETVSGFGLRVFPSGRKSFFAQFRVGHGRGARQRRVGLGPYGDLTVDEARRKARELISASRLGEDRSVELRTTVDEAMTVQGLCELWATEGAQMDRRTGRLRKPERIAEDLARLKVHIFPTLGTRRLNEVRRKDVERARDAITTGKTARRTKTKPRGIQRITGGAGAAARTLRVLSSVFSFAVEREYLETNPVVGVKRKPDKRLERFLSGDEIARIGQVLQDLEAEPTTNPNATNIIRLIALTGARRGEIEGLSWSEVDLNHRVIKLGDGKVGQVTIPLADAAVSLLQRLNATRCSEWVFPATRGNGPYRGTYKFWQKIRDLAELDTLRLHDVRHTFASIGASRGYSLQIIGAILGHKHASTTERYAHLARDPVRGAADEIGTAIASHLNPDAPTEGA